jgi:hypothetical protein
MKRVNSERNHREEDKANVMRCHSAICGLKGDLSLKHHRYRGIALAWTALVITALLLIVGLSLDVAKLAHNIHQMQNATDAAALAGAQIVKTSLPDDTQQITHDLGFANKAEHLEVTLRMASQPEPFTADQNSFDILIGRWVRYNRTFIPTLDAPNAVQAVARRNAALGATEPALRAIRYIFGPLAGVDTADAATLAVGWAYDSGGAGLICLSREAEPGLYLSGAADLDVDGGGIHVNSIAFPSNPSGNDAGANISGSALIDAGFINVVGGISPPPDSPVWVKIFEGGDEGAEGYSVSDGTTFPNPVHIEDPVASKMIAEDCPYVDVDAPAPAVPGSCLDLPDLIDTVIPTRTQTADATPITIGTKAIGYTCTLAPGYYPYGISLTKTGQTITLNPTADGAYSGPPIYIFGGAGGSPGSPSGLYVNGGNLIGEGVTCYVTKSYNYGNQWGVTRLMGNGTILLRSPGDQLRYEGDADADVDGLEGIAVWEDPTNPTYNPAKDYAHLNGGGGLSISGTIYFPNPLHVRLEGNLGECGNQILCGRAAILGKAVINVNYDNRNQGEASNVCLVR